MLQINMFVLGNFSHMYYEVSKSLKITLALMVGTEGCVRNFFKFRRIKASIDALKKRKSCVDTF